MGFVMVFSYILFVDPLTSHLFASPLPLCYGPHPYFIDHPSPKSPVFCYSLFSFLFSLPSLHFLPTILMFSFLVSQTIYKHENLNVGVLSRGNMQYLIF